MKCPHCFHSVRFDPDSDYFGYLHDDTTNGYCVTTGACPECGELIVVLYHGPYSRSAQGEELTDVTGEEILFPTTRARTPLPPEVTGEYRNDFDEAAEVLAISPKASAAISRRLLQHVLHEQFGLQGNSLARQIDDFIARSDIPSHLSEAVDAVRNIGNIAAHPLKDSQTGSVVDVEPGEAEWLLETLEAIYDYCFVQPARLAERKKQLNAKLAAIGKPPLKK